MIAPEVMAAFKKLKACRYLLNRHQYSTIKGQILSGDVEGAIRGLDRLKDKAKRKKV